MKQKYLKTLFWLLAISVLILSCLPGTESRTFTIENLDKVAHFFTFFLLSILLLLAYTFSKPFMVTAFLMTLFGLAIELLHLFIPNRVFSIYDFAADVLGILAAFLIYKLMSRKLQMV